MTVISVLSSSEAGTATHIEIAFKDSRGWASLSREFVQRFPEMKAEYISKIFETEENGMLEPTYNGAIILPVDEDNVVDTFRHSIEFVLSHLDKWDCRTLYIDLSPLEQLASLCKEVVVDNFASRFDVMVYVNGGRFYGTRTVKEKPLQT